MGCNLKEKQLYFDKDRESSERHLKARSVVREVQFSDDPRDFGYMAENVYRTGRAGLSSVLAGVGPKKIQKALPTGQYPNVPTSTSARAWGSSVISK